VSKRWLIVCLLCASSAFAHELEKLPDGGIVEKPEPAALETVVSARRPYTAASSSTVRNEDFASRPISDPSDILEVTPGLLTVQHAGGGKANQYFLRGFDIDHGTDLALSVDEVPVNLVSHGHGQGYADLHFLIPEAVERIQVTKGPYQADAADFATAGAANLVLKRTFAESEARVSFGSFNTYRALLIAAPRVEGPLQGYVVGEAYASDGPFRNPERTKRFNVIGRASYEPSASTSLSLTLMGYGGEWNASGQIPLRAVESGALDRFGFIDPTEGGSTQRYSATLAFHHHDPTGGRLKVTTYFVRNDFRLFSNFTFFAADPINGDQIEQVDGRNIMGLEARYEKSVTAGSIVFKTTGGARVRIDDIDNGLFSTKQRRRLATRVTSRIGEQTVGVFLEEDTQWLKWLRTVVGVRADFFNFDVTDRSALGGSTAAKAAGIISPKASVVLSPCSGFEAYLNFGRGFHSNDARGIVRRIDPVTPLATATGYEAGVRMWPVKGLDVALGAWALDLGSELVWVGDEGTTEARPATMRRGLEAEVRYRPLPWLRLDADVTWTYARFVEPTGGGTLIPLAPAFTWSGGVQVDSPIGIFGSVRVLGLSDRPANETGSIVAQGWNLVDLEAGYDHHPFRASIAVRNLLNTPWRQAQFANESRLAGESEPVEDLHFTPGYPLSVVGSVSVHF
jgi:outer membrane receptor protein involved in Fe transport